MMFLSFCFDLDFVPLVLKILLPLWIKFTMGQFLLLFLCKFCSYFSDFGGVLVSNQPFFAVID